MGRLRDQLERLLGLEEFPTDPDIGPWVRRRRQVRRSSLWLTLLHFTFDKEAGVLTLGWRCRRGRRPMSSVIGVQVIQTREQEPYVPGFATYQMNRILDDPAERRLNVNPTDLGSARSTARLAGDFVGVSVLDRQSVGPLLFA